MDKVYYNSDDSTTSQDSVDLWWKSEKHSVAKDLFSMASMLKQYDDSRLKRNAQSMQLYGGHSVNVFAPLVVTNVISPALPDARIKYNIVSSMSDTVTSKVGKMKPRITFLTSGGTWEDQMKARKLTKWNDGIFYKNKIYRKHRDMFRDATIFDTGCLKHFIQDGKIRSERVLSSELFVDQMDAMYGEPTHLYHSKLIRKDELIEQFADGDDDLAHKIANSGHDTDGELAFFNKLDEHVQVIEAWKLPTGDESGDGKHTICVENAVLVDEEYEKDYFPFTFFNWSPPVVGFWGQSLGNRLVGNQLEINKMLRIIQRSFHLGSAFKVFLEYGSKVAREHINNEIGSIVYYSGTKPEFYVPQTVHREFFTFLEWLIQSSYEEAGISQMSASAKKPADLESGRALREFNLIETERFATVAQAYEESFMDTTRIYTDLAHDLYTSGEGDVEIKTGSKKFLESIKWSEIDLDADSYIMKMYPTSLLPTEPAGRIATIQEWVNSGIIPPEEGMRLLDFPDIEGYRSLQDSPIDDHYFVLEQLLYKGKWISPEPYEDLGGALPFMQKALLRARVDEAPDDRMDLIRRWMSQADVLLKRAEQEAQVQAAKAQMEAAGGPAAAQAGPGPEAGVAGPGQAPMPEEIMPGADPTVPVV